MHTPSGVAPATTADRQQRLRSTAVRHVHWFRYSGADPFSGSSMYSCRCGVVRPSI
ncbi:hypothetical protein GCU60_00615 [Blastococcus saxobsidens]|uniref:Uncharacterized protein n=1 Tax=Blastococcus saxobsidens TaxID=138336 RepID=A0A6L9VXU0_9ACTN|nr:hypothetical protein [Blastococcus saxobsidens]NEK84279.1 hypothetical protein [Blastococcus saxobsidens]